MYNVLCKLFTRKTSEVYIICHDTPYLFIDSFNAMKELLFGLTLESKIGFIWQCWRTFKWTKTDSFLAYVSLKLQSHFDASTE